MNERARHDELDRSILPIPERPYVGPVAVDIANQRPSFSVHAPLRPPRGAPNVVIVLIDDMGFGAPSTFGGPVQMPTADRLADNGLVFTRFHTTSLCSPTRAALLAGRNHHSVGMGTVGELATGAPGYTCMRPRSAATVAKILTCNGYATGAFGKMHQTPPWEVSPAGPFDRWPTGDGFERFYGFLGAETNHYYPSLYEGTTAIDPPRKAEEGYHFSEDLVDQAIGWVIGQRALTPDKPFFCYLSFGACHAPLHVRADWVDPYRHAFDHGWNRQRELTLERQRTLGVVPSDAELSPWPAEVPAWHQLSGVEREAACRLMELYAGFATHTDAQVGRFINTLEQHEILADTLVFYILGDNGASAEGGLAGTLNEFTTVNGFVDTAERIMANVDRLGGPGTYPHYPLGWALAMDTPYQWVKQVASHYGGTRNGMVVHWPGGIAARGELRHQWHHCIDVVPTILEVAGVPAPHLVDGVAQQPIEGISMGYAFDDAGAADRHTTQYFEMLGNRGIYHEGWVACTKHRTPWQLVAPAPDLVDDVWELYDTRTDWTQARNMATERPEKLSELQALFLIEAARHQVLPLDDRLVERFFPDVAGRYSLTADRERVTYPGSTRRLPEDAVINVRNRSHTVTANVVVHHPGTGVIAAQGGAFGGWSLYLHQGRLTYCHNVVGVYRQYVRSNNTVDPGEHLLVMEFRYNGGGFGRGASVTLLVDGESVGDGHLERTTPFSFSFSDTFNVGIDIGTPVSEDYPAMDNSFCGEVRSVSISTSSDAVEEGPRERAHVALNTH